MKQHLHHAMAPIDVLTRVELEETMTKQYDRQTRERYRGIDTARLPPIMVTAVNTGPLQLGAIGPSDGFAGPEEGDVWLLRRANVVSSVFATDTAKYVLFRGSTPSDIAGGYTNRQVLDGMTLSPATQSVMNTPSIPASTVPVQNLSTGAYFVSITGGTVTLVTVNGNQVGTGDGIYLVPSGGTIAITYSVIPTSWVWVPTGTVTAQLGNNQGVEYDCPNKGGLFQPGEQLYAQIYNATVGNTYLLTAEFIRCPAEMKGKLF